MAGLSALPQHLQLKVLSMLDDGAFDKVVEGATAPAPAAARGAPARAPDTTYLHPVSTPFTGQRAIEDINARGLAVFDSFLGPSAANAIRAAAMDIAGRGLMRRARMGKDGTQWADPRARGDTMIWVNDLAAMLQGPQADRADDEASGTAGASEHATAGARCAQEAAVAIAEIGRAVDKLKAAGEEICSAIGGQFECSKMTFQLAHYTDGARYVRHSDVGPQTPDRRLTCIYYLNPNWTRADGGELRLYLPASRVRESAGGVQPVDPCDVAPRMDRLIIFRSEIEHEVLPSAAPRLALSGWIYSPVRIESCFPELLLREMPDLEMPENAALSGMGPNAAETFCRLRSTQWSLSGENRTDSSESGESDEGMFLSSSVPPRKGPIQVFSPERRKSAAPVRVIAPPSARPAQQAHGSLTDALCGLTLAAAETAPPALGPAANRQSEHSVVGGGRTRGNGKIFVSVVAYRDPECPATIADLFAKAQHPDKVFVGLITQCDPEADLECLLDYYLEKSGDSTLKRFEGHVREVAYIHTYLPTYLYTHTHTHTHAHAHTHVYIFMYICIHAQHLEALRRPRSRGHVIWRVARGLGVGV